MNINIRLPESLKSWVEEQATLEGYSTPAEYVQQVLRKEHEAQARKLRQEIEKRLLEALDSGDPVEATPEFWEARRQELKNRLERQGKANDA